MEDTISHSSIDSSGIDEFVLVNSEFPPRLRIGGNGGSGELERRLCEVLTDELTNIPAAAERSAEAMSAENPATEVESSKEKCEVKITNVGDPLTGCQDDNSAENKETPPTKPSGAVTQGGDSTVEGMASVTDSSTSSNGMTGEGVGGGENILFTSVTYLGSAAVNAPRSENEINRNMAILNDQSQMSIPITLSVPNDSEGIVYLLDPVTSQEISSYPIHRILFCAKGPLDSSESKCFAFTSSHGDNAETAIFQCHVFRCDAPEANVGKILYSFATSFRRVPKSAGSSVSVSMVDNTNTTASNNVFKFNVAVEFREIDSKGNFVACPKDKNVFKLRCNIEKRIYIFVSQTSGPKELKIERCFGLLISPGRNVKDSDMHLIEMVSMGNANDSKSTVICASWDPTDPNFTILNTETPKDSRVFMTIAVDLVIEGIQEPVRFLVEARAKLFPSSERFWYFTTKPHVEQFILKLNPCAGMGTSSSAGQLLQYQVISIESQTELDRKKSHFSLGLSPGKIQPPAIAMDASSTPDAEVEDSDNDEPLLSGSGAVSKDITDEELLESWHDVLVRWHQNLKQRPRQVHSLVRKGIPEPLRGEVWQLLAGCSDSVEMLEAYRLLINKDSPCEQVILRDINRTFPAHDYFKETGGVGQDALYKISKAYSVYDEEVGYCQGVSFLAAAVLLHMPEEQAFCLLVKIMFDYNMRDVFKQNFEDLHIKFYQLERLMQDYLGDLFDHFMDLGLEAHMYASQWFLTLFTAKFPLSTVFHILDVFISEGIETIFNVALALLKTSRKELLALDFEGVLKFFRVQLPKRYRTEESARELMNTAVSMKVSMKKLKRYEKEFLAIKEAQMMQEDPVERLGVIKSALVTFVKRENKKLLEANIRLEQENDDLAQELVMSKINLRKELDEVEDKCDVLNKELLQSRSQLTGTEEELKRLESESLQLKEVCRRELDRSESECARNQTITADYKQICSQLSERLEKLQTSHKSELSQIKKKVSQCESCSRMITEDGLFSNILVELRSPTESLDPLLMEKDRMIRELELELAQTKLALVESECKNQDVVHQLNSAVTEIQASKNTWFQKTLTSLREATATKGAGERVGGGMSTSTSRDKEMKEMSRKDSLHS